jgi:DNA-nicking Smr family endonuclease
MPALSSKDIQMWVLKPSYFDYDQLDQEEQELKKCLANVKEISSTRDLLREIALNDQDNEQEEEIEEQEQLDEHFQHDREISDDEIEYETQDTRQNTDDSFIIHRA